MNKGTVVGIVAVVIIALSVVMMWVSYSNKEVDLRSQFEAKEKVCMSYYDKMWKVLKQKAGIVDKYSKDFESIYVKIMEGRYSSGGGLMKWVQERNPEFDASLYKDLMASVEGQREGFHREQSVLIDIDRRHKNLRQKMPSKFFVGDADPFEVKIITSAQSKQVFETGEENDVDLFKSKPQSK